MVVMPRPTGPGRRRRARSASRPSGTRSSTPPAAARWASAVRSPSPLRRSASQTGSATPVLEPGLVPTASTSRLTHGMPSGSAPAEAGQPQHRPLDRHGGVGAGQPDDRAARGRGPATGPGGRSRRRGPACRARARRRGPWLTDVCLSGAGAKRRISRSEVASAGDPAPLCRTRRRFLGPAVSGAGARAPAGSSLRIEHPAGRLAWQGCARFAPRAATPTDETARDSRQQHSGRQGGTVSGIASAGRSGRPSRRWLAVLGSRGLAAGALGGPPVAAATTPARTGDAACPDPRQGHGPGVPDAHRAGLRRTDPGRRPGSEAGTVAPTSGSTCRLRRSTAALGRLEPGRRLHPRRLHQRPLGVYDAMVGSGTDPRTRVRLRHGRRQAGRGRLQQGTPDLRRRGPRQLWLLRKVPRPGPHPAPLAFGRPLTHR